MLSSLGENMVVVSNTECALSGDNSGRSESRIGELISSITPSHR